MVSKHLESKVIIRHASEADASGIARTFIDSRRNAHRDHIPAESLLQLSYEESARNWGRKLREIGATLDGLECVYVAELTGTGIIGVAMGGPERSHHALYTGEVYILYLLPAYHRQGLGRRLAEAVVRYLAQRGINSFLIRVLKANTPARLFYEALGGHLLWEEQIEEDGAILDQVAYGWSDSGTLLRHHDR
jgi:ribosomal protein S18 acetylase RimI-like enzyme